MGPAVPPVRCPRSGSTPTSSRGSGQDYNQVSMSDSRRFWIRFGIRFGLDAVTHPVSTAPMFKRVLAQFWRYPYRGRRRMLRALGPNLASMTTWSAVDTELHGEMAEVFNRTPRVQKLAHYLPIYESVVTEPGRSGRYRLVASMGARYRCAGIPSPRLAHRRY